MMGHQFGGYQVSGEIDPQIQIHTVRQNTTPFSKRFIPVFPLFLGSTFDIKFTIRDVSLSVRAQTRKLYIYNVLVLCK